MEGPKTGRCKSASNVVKQAHAEILILMDINKFLMNFCGRLSLKWLAC